MTRLTRGSDYKTYCRPSSVLQTKINAMLLVDGIAEGTAIN